MLGGSSDMQHSNTQNWPFDPAKERYVNLATYRRSGIAVKTPVWIAGSAGIYYVFSEGKAGKVKRIRANSKARLAGCDFRGNVHSEWLDARGTLVTDVAVIERAYKALHKKYGWQMGIGDFFSRLSGRYKKRAIIELEIINEPSL